MTGERLRAVVRQSAMVVKCNSMVMARSLYNIPAARSALLGDLRETDLLIISVVPVSDGPARVRRFRFCSGGKGS